MTRAVALLTCPERGRSGEGDVSPVQTAGRPGPALHFFSMAAVEGAGGWEVPGHPGGGTGQPLPPAWPPVSPVLHPLHPRPRCPVLSTRLFPQTKLQPCSASPRPLDKLLDSPQRALSPANRLTPPAFSARVAAEAFLVVGAEIATPPCGGSTPFSRGQQGTF